MREQFDHFRPNSSGKSLGKFSKLLLDGSNRIGLIFRGFSHKSMDVDFEVLDALLRTSEAIEKLKDGSYYIVKLDIDDFSNGNLSIQELKSIIKNWSLAQGLECKCYFRRGQAYLSIDFRYATNSQ